MFKIIKTDIYPYEIIISIGNSYKELKEKLSEILPKDMHKEIKRFKGEYNGRTIMFDSGQTVIDFKTINARDIAHEAFHAVTFILGTIGMTLSEDSDEAYAYFLGFLVEEITKFNESCQ